MGSGSWERTPWTGPMRAWQLITGTCYATRPVQPAEMTGVMMEFSDKVVFVTAAAGAGIGQAVARTFAREGATVVLSRPAPRANRQGRGRYR